MHALSDRVVPVAGSYYEIAVRGTFGTELAHWFSFLEIGCSGPEATRLRGWFDDQRALRDLLGELGDLGVPIRSVRQLPGRP